MHMHKLERTVGKSSKETRNVEKVQQTRPKRRTNQVDLHVNY